MRKLILGCGYLGRRVAERWQRAGCEVVVVTRSAPRAAQFARQGFTPLIADVTCPASLPDLAGFTTVLYAVGYDRSAGRSMHEVYVTGLAQVLEHVVEPPQRWIYISSTGVYGDQADAWVDESTPCRPDREGGAACWAAEQLLSASPLGSRTIILRLAGLYGPGRIPRLRELQAGQPIAAPPQACLNLIHVDDAADVVLAAEAHAPVPSLYVVSDDCPVVRATYYAELARLVDAPPPRFDSSTGPARRGSGHRRVRNAKLRHELPVALRYPTYREGLVSAVAGLGQDTNRVVPEAAGTSNATDTPSAG